MLAEVLQAFPKTFWPSHGFRRNPLLDLFLRQTHISLMKETSAKKNQGDDRPLFLLGTLILNRSLSDGLPSVYPLSFILSNGPLFGSAHTARPETDPCFASRTLRGLKRTPVLLRAHCAASNGPLFCFAHTARPQTGPCLASRTLRGPKRIPVLLRAHCAARNGPLFSFAHTARPETDPCFASRTLRGLKRAPVLLRAHCAA